MLAELPEKERNEEHRKKSGGQHAPDHPRADRMPAGRARARAHCQRQHPQDEGKRRHDDWAEAQPRSFDRGIRNRGALAMALTLMVA